MGATTLGITTLSIMTLSIKGQFTTRRWNVVAANLVEFLNPIAEIMPFSLKHFFLNNNQVNVALNKIEEDLSLDIKTFSEHNWFQIVIG
jgi:hypothetical protein